MNGDLDSVNPYGPDPDQAGAVAATSTNTDTSALKWQKMALDTWLANLKYLGPASSTQLHMWTTMMRQNPYFPAIREMWGDAGMLPKAADAFRDSARLINCFPSLKPLMEEQMRHNADWHEVMHSPLALEFNGFMGTLLPGSGELYQRYNHQFLSEDSHGHVRAVSIGEIDALFPREGKDFPHVIMAPNHAIAETLSDMTDLTHGIEVSAERSHEQKLNIAHVNGHIDGGENRTLILFACDTERNPFLNAERLLKRLEELEEVKRSGKPDQFKYASPGSFRIAGLFLREMAQNPADVEVLDAPPYMRVHYPLQLRANANAVIQHFQGIGFSLGGETVSTALRYLVTQMVDRDGQPRVELPEGKSVHDLIRNIGCMSIAALEVPMDEFYKNHGVRRDSFNNESDVVSNHKDFPGSWGDHKWKTKGPSERLGHEPKDAFGTREGGKGYLLEDPHVARLMKEATAPLFGKAVISSIAFEHPLLEQNNRIIFGTSAGTSDDRVEELAPMIEQHLRMAGLTGVKLAILSGSGGRAFYIEANEDIRTDPKAIGKLQRAFTSMRNTRDSGLVIADAIMNKNFVSRLETVQIQGDGGRPR